MYFKFSSILMLVVLFTHCKNSNQTNTSKNTIGETQMIALLTEIHLVEGSTNLMYLYGDSLTQYVLNNYEFLFQKYHTNQAGFRETMDYYVQHPKEMDKVYEKVVENLSKMQSEIKN